MRWCALNCTVFSRPSLSCHVCGCSFALIHICCCCCFCAHCHATLAAAAPDVALTVLATCVLPQLLHQLPTAVAAAATRTSRSYVDYVWLVSAAMICLFQLNCGCGLYWSPWSLFDANILQTYSYACWSVQFLFVHWIRCRQRDTVGYWKAGVKWHAHITNCSVNSCMIKMFCNCADSTSCI